MSSIHRHHSARRLNSVQGHPAEAEGFRRASGPRVLRERNMKKSLTSLVGFLLIVAVVLASASLSSCAKKTQKIVVASDATWPPMEFVDENKNVTGFDIDLVNEIAKAGGFEVEIKNTAWDGIFAGLAAGNYQAVASSVTITDERKATMDFSEPYVNAGQVIVVQKSTTGVSTLSDLVGKKAGAQIGTTGAIEVEKVQGVELKTYDEVGLAFEDLANGNIQAVVADSPIAANFALQNPKFADKLQITGAAFTDEWLGFAFKKGDAKTLKLFNEGLAKVKSSGKLDELVAKWLAAGKQ